MTTNPHNSAVRTNYVSHQDMDIFGSMVSEQHAQSWRPSTSQNSSGASTDKIVGEDKSRKLLQCRRNVGTVHTRYSSVKFEGSKGTKTKEYQYYR